MNALNLIVNLDCGIYIAGLDPSRACWSSTTSLCPVTSPSAGESASGSVHQYTSTLSTPVHLVHQYTSAPVHQYTSTPVHQYTNTPIHQYTNTPVHQYTSTPVHQYTSTSVHQYTSTPVHQYTSTHRTPVHQFISTPVPLVHNKLGS